MKNEQLIIDLTGIKEKKLRESVKSVLQKENVLFDERKDFWSQIKDDQKSDSGHSIIFSDFSQLVRQIKKIGEDSWPYIVQSNNAYFFTFIRNHKDEKMASYIDDLVKLSYNKLSVCNAPIIGKSKKLSGAFEKELQRVLITFLHPNAIKYAHVHKQRKSFIIEFNDGLFGEVTFRDLELSDEIDQLMLDTLRINEFGNAIELFNHSGETFDIDGDVLRYFLSDKTKQQIKEYSLESAHHLGELVKAVRKSQKLTQNELSKVTGIDQAIVSKIENGKHLPRIDTIERIANGFGLSVTKFLNTQQN
jgi:DNA-binding XRE family transcriptional regulator